MRRSKLSQAGMGESDMQGEGQEGSLAPTSIIIQALPGCWCVFVYNM